MKFDPKTAEILANAQEGVAWITQRLDSLDAGKGKRDVVVAALYDLAIEHHVGILAALRSGAIASAFALLRAQFEALVRAGWLHLVATDEQFGKFADKSQLPAAGAMAEALDTVPDFAHGMLKRVHDQNFKAMHGFTHGGMEQVEHRYKKNEDGGLTMEPNYPAEAVQELMEFAGTFALISLRQIARKAGNAAVEAEITQRVGA